MEISGWSWQGLSLRAKLGRFPTHLFLDDLYLDDLDDAREPFRVALSKMIPAGLTEEILILKSIAVKRRLQSGDQAIPCVAGQLRHSLRTQSRQSSAD